MEAYYCINELEMELVITGNGRPANLIPEFLIQESGTRCQTGMVYLFMQCP